MHRIGKIVVVNGKGKFDGKIYNNKKGTILECDAYYKDYHILFSDGTDDWISPQYITATTSKKKIEKKKEKKT